MNEFLFNIVSIGAAAVFFTGLWVSFAHRHDRRFRAFGTTVVICFVWLMAYAFLTRVTDPVAMRVGAAVFYGAGLSLPVAMLAFALTWLDLTGQVRRLRLALVAAGLTACWLGATTVHLSPTSVTSSPVVVFTYLGLVIAALTILAVGIRTIDAKESPGGMAAMMFGKILVVNAAFNLMFAEGLGVHVGSVLPVFMFIAGLGIMTLFLGNLRLLVDLRFVAVELIMLAVLFILLADLVGSTNEPLELLFRVVILIALVGFAALMTNNLVKHIRRIKENEMLRDQLIRLNGRLIEADRAKTKLVAFVAHQLQSPLAGAHIYLNMARKGEFGEISPELRKVLDNNMDVVHRLIQTNQTFLNVTKIDLGRVDLVKEMTDLAQLAERVVAEATPQAEAKGLGVRVMAQPNLPLVGCDSTYIFHALMNLVDNAIKYTEVGGVTVNVHAESESSIRVCVNDTGMGLADGDRERLFGVFQRGVAAVNLEAKGEGLGLYIVKQFVEAHGGEVFFDSPGPGRGSTFGFTLPVQGGTPLKAEEGSCEPPVNHA
jgi:signal transduction histidine kinase